MQRLIFNFRLIRRLTGRYMLVWLADTVSIALTALVLPGIYFVRDVRYWYLAPFVVSLGLGLLNALVRPVLIILILPITFVTLGLVTLGLNAFLFYLMHLLVGSFVVANFLAAVAGVLVLTLVNTLLGNFVQIGDEYSFYSVMMDKLSSLTRPKAIDRVGRGVIIFQIDGLPYATLKRALKRGKMPYLAAFLRRNRYAIRKWFSGLPSQTSAVQAAMFYGNAFDIPGFRWYDKTAGRLVVSSNAADMQAVDDRIGSESVSLLRDGTCINSLLHGSASKRILTVSAFTDKDLRHHRASLEDFAIFSLHPYLYTRTILFMVWDFIVDRAQYAWERIKRRRPALKRSIKSSMLRALGNTFFRESATYFILEDVVRGIPIIYANYLGYDVVSHHGGPNSWDAISTLTGIDRQIKKIGRTIAKKADKHFDLIVLSDHGQTPCVPFENLYKQTLTEAIEAHLGRKLVDRGGHTAELGYFDTLLREMRMVEEAYGTRPIRRSRRTLERLHATMKPQVTEPPADESVVVCPNGCLAHVYLTELKHRVTTEQLLERHPNLLEFLISHAGVGFVATTSNDGEFLVMGKKGMCRLKAGTVEGEDPLDAFAEGVKKEMIRAALASLCSYPNSGDIILNGAMLARGVVVSFEPQRGTHGGVGGDQTDPFILYPRKYGTKQERARNPVEMHAFLEGLLPR